MNTFTPGLKLSEYFYDELIQPMMAEGFPRLSYASARLEWGSDVMGFDTPMSMDHGWGPKLTLFLTQSDFDQYQGILDDYFANHLPFEFRGFSTHFAEPLSDGGVITKKDSYPIHHGITITTPEQFFRDYLGVDVHQPLTPPVWLTIPQQRLFTLRSGQIFSDGLGTLSELRYQFHWYPHDLWLYLMANQWQRIDQDEPFIGRTGTVGDVMGARLIAARLIGDLMHLCFLIEKQYAPYRKWFGSAFQQLSIASKMMPIFEAVLNSTKWQEIETHLTQAYLLVMQAHNDLRITPIIELEVTNFFNRPFQVPHSARFVNALIDSIRDPLVKVLPPHLGSIDQLSDNTDLLTDIPRCQLLQILYQHPSNLSAADA
jgi:hypothetical protein